ncbi:hypothetical protein JCM39194_04040 [Desulfotomaculum varum]
MSLPPDEKCMMSYFASVNAAARAAQDLTEAGFQLPYINSLAANYPTDVFTQSIHPDLSGGTLSDLEYNYAVPFIQPPADKLQQAFAIVRQHGGKI